MSNAIVRHLFTSMKKIHLQELNLGKGVNSQEIYGRLQGYSTPSMQQPGWSDLAQADGKQAAKSTAGRGSGNVDSCPGAKFFSTVASTLG